MTRAERLHALFLDALRHAPEERGAFLQSACGDDATLRREVTELLQADAAATAADFLGAPIQPVADLLGAVDRTESDESLQGRNVGPYALVRRLGHGGMGDVYLALREQPFRQYVALKLIRGGLETPDLRLRFEMERQILAALNHPHIARLLDGGTTADGLAYFAMEYVEGEPITAYADRQRLSLDDRLRLFAQVCHAVHYAHQNLIVHRDLKPSNILVAEDGAGRPHVKLLDFGVAKLLNPALTSLGMPVTQTMARLLTPDYASPEQVRGLPVTTASDVYSLGVLLYELLCGHRPYRLTLYSAPEVERIVCEQDPERPSTRALKDEPIAGRDGTTRVITAAEVSAARRLPADRLRRRLRGDLDNVVMTALRKEPARRYASARQLAIDVERHLAGLPVEARPNTLGYRVQKFVVRHRTPVVAALLAIAALVAALSMSLGQEARVRAERDRAEVALATSEEVNAFLLALFMASEPGDVLGDTTAVRTLLERGVVRAEALADQPAAQARLLHVLGEAYLELGSYARADTLLRQALAAEQTVQPPSAERLADLQHALGVLARRADGPASD